MATTNTPDLATFDWIIVSSSAGKDSQAMLDYVVELARDAGVIERVVVAHADLGRLEWLGTKELAAEHAAHYGLRFEVVRKAEHGGDLLRYVEARAEKLAAQGKKDTRAWPMVGMCNGTSDFKRAQIAKLATRLAAESRAAGVQTPRILDCVGLAKHESSGRAKRLAKLEAEHGYAMRIERSNGRIHFEKWYPVANWSLEDIWARIDASGTRYHYAYGLGMSRLSCCFCIAASEADLRIAAAHNPELAREYIAMEKTAGSFKRTKTLASIVGDVVEDNHAPRTRKAHFSTALAVLPQTAESPCGQLSLFAEAA